MAKDTVTNQTLYTEILKIHEKIDEVVDKRITPLERTMDRLWMYASFFGTIAGLLVTGVFDWIKSKFLKI